MGEAVNRQLLESAQNGDLRGVKAAIEAGADINAALERAIESNHPNAFAIVKHLVEHGADLHVRNGLVLIHAMESTNINAFAILKYLVENGRRCPPSSSVRVSATDASGGQAGIDSCDGWVLGKVTKNTNPDAFAILKYLVGKNGLKPLDDDDGPLRNAVKNTNPDAFAMVRYLVENGADVNAGNGRILSSAVVSMNRDAFAIVRYLVEQGCNVNALDGLALREAVESRYQDVFAIVRYLVEKGADVNAYDGQALVRVAGRNHPDAFAIVKYLIEHGADVNAANQSRAFQSRALQNAAGSINPDAFAIVRYLIEHGANINAYYAYEISALQASALSVNPDALEIVKYLIEQTPLWGRGDGVSFSTYRNNIPSTLVKVAKGSNPNALSIIELLIQHINVHSSCDRYDTLFAAAVGNGASLLVNHLLSRDDFLLSDLMPRQKEISSDEYKACRKKVMAHISESIDNNGMAYVKSIAADIEKILKSNNPKPTKEDIKALQPLAKKIAAKDWVADAQVSSDDFLGCDMER